MRSPPAKRGIAMVFQSYALYPHMTCYEQPGLRPRRRPATTKAEIEPQVARAAAHAADRAAASNASPRQLSGGQRQRVAIGRAIVREPRHLPLRRAAVQPRCRTARQHARRDRPAAPQLGTTMIYVTHDQVEAMTMADKIVVLNAGRIEQVGAPLELYNNPANRFVAGFIGSPKMNFLQREDRAGRMTADTTINVCGSSIRLPSAA